MKPTHSAPHSPPSRSGVDTTLAGAESAGLSEALARLVLSELELGDLCAIIERELRAGGGFERVALWLLRDGAEGEKVLIRSTGGQGVVDCGREPELPTEPVKVDERSPKLLRQLQEASFGLGVDRGSSSLIPLRSGSRFVGVISVDRPPSSLGGTLSISGFAAQAASVIANFLSLENAHRHETQLSALSDSFTELSSSFDLDELLASTIASASAVVQAPIAYIMLLDPSEQEIYMRSAAGITSKRFGRLRLRMGAGLGGNVLELRRPFLTANYLIDESFDHLVDVDEVVREEGIKSITGIPMFTRGNFVGVLFVAHRTAEVTNSEEIEILTRLAQYAALAIETARLRERDREALRKIKHSMSIISGQNHQLRRAEKAQERLTEALLTGGGLHGILATFSDIVPGSAMLLRGDRIVASVGEPSSTIASLLEAQGLLASAQREPEIARVSKALRRAEPSTIDISNGDGGKRSLVVPVVASEEVLGSLWVEVEGAAVDEYRAVLEQTARAAALELLRERSIREAELRLQREFLDDLLAANPSGPVIERRAESLRISLDGPLRLCVIGSQDSDDDLRVAEVREETCRSLQSEPWCRFAAEHLGFVVAILVSEEPPKPLIERVLAETGQRSLAAVVSDQGLTVTDFSEAYWVACRLLGVATGGLVGRVIDLSEARTLTLLIRKDDDGSLWRFVNATLGPLLELEPEKRTDLLQTLETFLAVGMSPKRAAAELHIHVNTLYYRIERLRELLGPSFSTPARALDFQIACLARRILLSES